MYWVLRFTWLIGLGPSGIFSWFSRPDCILMSSCTQLRALLVCVCVLVLVRFCKNPSFCVGMNAAHDCATISSSFGLPRFHTIFRLIHAEVLGTTGCWQKWQNEALLNLDVTLCDWVWRRIKWDISRSPRTRTNSNPDGSKANATDRSVSVWGA